MKYQLFFPLTAFRNQLRLSERELAEGMEISRSCLRKTAQAVGNITIQSIVTLASYFNRRVETLVVPDEIFSEYSTIATALKVERDGFDSWKIHFFDFVDELRRSLDPRLILLPPHRKFDVRLSALLASMVQAVCEELGMDRPHWVKKSYFLKSPWFVSGVKSLKASALVESPLPFRRNNIFVQANILERA